MVGDLPRADSAQVATAIEIAVTAGSRVIALGAFADLSDVAVAAAVRAATAHDVAVLAPASTPGRGQTAVAQRFEYAVAFVAGTAALVRSAYPNLDAAAAHRIKATADGASAGVPDRRIGWGTVDPDAAVSAVVSGEQPPTTGGEDRWDRPGGAARRRGPRRRRRSRRRVSVPDPPPYGTAHEPRSSGRASAMSITKYLPRIAAATVTLLMAAAAAVLVTVVTGPVPFDQRTGPPAGEETSSATAVLVTCALDR
ncbi:hypothetical protein [Micromonospora sp. NBC_00858]|uniref:hypothetical protein n=1 Tax=Micromonospora sp. NBC_00858 TaxID=2975979 RepID=UPI003865C166|nr:hypothetical protein OG990_04320 [Micromonospora sp. NBC_00858]